MGRYEELSDPERRKLAEGLRRAAESIRGAGQTSGFGRPAIEHPQLVDELLTAVGPETQPTRRRRPSYRLRLRIDGYAFSAGFAICGLGELLASFFSFLAPGRDPVSRRFLKILLHDDPQRGDPSGFSLSRTLLELARAAENLLRGGGFLRREADRHYNLSAELKRDLAVWEPQGLKLLSAFQRFPGSVFETLDAVRARDETWRGVDVLELAELVRTVLRSSLLAAAPPEAVRETLEGTGALIKARYRRIFHGEEELARLGKRVDRQVEEFLACWARLKWFAHEMYPAMLKLLRVFRREEELPAILPQVLRFAGLDPADLLTMERPLVEPPPPVAAPADVESPAAIDLNAAFHGILTILRQAFPSCRIERVADRDFSTLAWFHHKIYRHIEYRGPLVSRRPDFTDLLGNVSRRDPLGAIVVLHELIGQLLECLNPEMAGRLVDPLVLGGPFPQKLLDIRAHWSLAREVLLLRYLQELEDLHKQHAVLGPQSFQRYLASAASRKSLESVNQLRNHLIRGYGQVILKLDRQELFRVPPLFDVTRELCRLLARLVPERRQIGAGSPIPLHRLQTGDLLQIPPGPLLRQVRNWIEAVPASERLLPDPQAEANRLFLEILYGAADFLDFLLNDERSPLFALGGQVVLAGEEDRELREEIELDRTPLRVELRRDFEPVDRLTGLQSKNEYLRIAPTLFRQEQLAGRELALLVMDLDRFKTVNDSLGHQFGDTLLALAGQAVLACCREEDPAVRFGGDELLVVLRGGAAAGTGLAERIRERFEELKAGEPAARLSELRTPPAAGAEAGAGRIGTLSIGVAQGLGAGHPQPAVDEQDLFRRADQMLYLAKELGGNRTVTLVDGLKLPLLPEELAACQHFAGDGAAFIEQCGDTGHPLTFAGFQYASLLEGRPLNQAR